LKFKPLLSLAAEERCGCSGLVGEKLPESAEI